MEQTLQNIRFALRTLAKNRTFTLFAILTLGLGIGANTAIFSVIDGVLLKPLPYTSGERLLLVRQSAPLAGRANAGVSIKELYDYREQSASFDALVEYHQMNFDLLKQGEPDRVNVGVVSHDFFNILGIAPIAGRTFVADDDKPGADATLVLSHSYWMRAFGGDRAVVGRVFQMNDRPHTVVGILPEVPLYPQENDVYMSVSACPFRAAAERRIGQNRRVFAALGVFGRLKPGVTQEQATADVRAVCHRFAAANPGAYAASSGFTATTLSVRNELTRQARPLLLILLGTTSFVLLIACSNVANLSLARLLRRERELAVRAALGAGRGQLVRQLLTESVVLSLAGGVVGIIFASSTLSMLTTFIARFTSRTKQIEIDPRVLLFTLGISFLTGIVFGILPALSPRADLVSAMKQGSKGAGDSPGRRRVQSGLIVLQVAVSVVLLVGAGLLLTSLYRLQRVDPGYRADRVIAAEAFPNFTKYAQAQTAIHFYQEAIRRIESEPGVVGVAVTNAVPLSAIAPGPNPVLIKGETDAATERRPTADISVTSPGYFAILDIPLDGRDFSTVDKVESPAVVIVNRAMTKYWKRGSPIGSQVSLDNGQTWATVVGVSGDVRQYGLDRETLPQLFVPLAQSGGVAGRFLVRTEGDPLGIAQMIRTDIHAVDPDMPIKNVRTLAELRSQFLATPKLTALLLTVFAALALVVTLAGISGVIAISVTHRLEEFGVRMALGATRPQILTQVIGQGLRLVVVGLVAGLALSFAATKVLSAYLFATAPTDPATLALVCV
ncbi:MAG TPA: ABC transporter permease, partial [Vicinamibacterales bacterium]|nr:ABC transporter permease [Vicinamibacterales bacterium]